VVGYVRLRDARLSVGHLETTRQKGTLVAGSATTLTEATAGVTLVALDGPGGSGKSTVARRLARELGFAYLDTGATYRAVTLAGLRAGPGCELTALAQDLVTTRLVLSTDPAHEAVLLDGEDVTHEIRGPAVTAGVSAVAAVPSVRQVLVGWQRRRALETPPGCVLEGRDTGSVVAPDASVKIWLTAAPAIRAARRSAESGSTAAADLHRRDGADAARATDPMRPADDAFVVDTSEMDLDETVAFVVTHVRGMLA
jgi:cytidylate kinase